MSDDDDKQPVDPAISLRDSIDGLRKIASSSSPTNLTEQQLIHELDVANIANARDRETLETATRAIAERTRRIAALRAELRRRLNDGEAS
jgi:hypothetical protein